MAISNLNLNVRANTSRALADFNKFSRSLDNKFLVSGLKLDVIRNALNTINRDFQRAIGEQGLASAGSLRAAQNQAALLTQTFKGFASESALAITTQIGTALNRVAVTAGGTMKDVQRTLAATPFISTNLSEDLRKQLSIGIMSAQRDFRRAGLGDNFGGIAQQFLMGRATGMQLVETGGAIESFLGAEIIKRAGGEGRIYSPEMRSEILAQILNDPDIQDQLKLMARRAAGFRIVLEDLNTQLFNTESGVFGALRKVIDRSGKSTTMFDEVNELVESIFGKDGMFRSIFKSIKEVFGIGDPMRPLITAVQFIKGMVDEFTKFFSGPVFKDILQFSKEALSRVGDLFREIYETVRGADFSPDSIRDAIGQIGSSLREYIREFGEYIRGQDISDESGVVGGIAGTLLEEVGKTAVTVIKELFSTLVNKVPEIATQVLPELNKGINAVLTEAFGSLAPLVKTMVATMPGPLGMAARASLITDFTGGQGGLGLLGAAAPFLLAGRGGPVGALKSLGGTSKGATAFRGLGLSLAGLDPAVSLLGALAPQLLGGILKSARQLSEAPGRIMNASRFGISPGRTIIRGVQGGFGLLGRGISGIGDLLSGGARYLGAVRPRPDGGGGTPGPGGGGGGTPGPQRGRPPGGGPSASIPSRFMESVREGIEDIKKSNKIEEYDRRELVARGYKAPIGPQPRAEDRRSRGDYTPYNWAASKEYGNQQGYAPYMESGLNYSFERTGKTDIRETTASRFNRRYGSGGKRAVLGRRVRGIGRRFGKAGLIAGGLTAVLGAASFLGGPGARSAELEQQGFSEEEREEILRQEGREKTRGFLGLGAGMLGGAVGGAALGSVFGPVGTAIGGVLGGVLGEEAVNALSDEVLDGITNFGSQIGSFISNLGTTFTSAWTGFTKWIGESVSWAGEKLEEAFKFAVNGVINALNVAIRAFTALPRALIGSIEGFIKNVPFPGKEQALGTLGSLKSFYSMQIPNFYGGKNYYGPAMAKEAMMSGRKPMVVNDSEFVIPRDGFPILAGLVGQNLRSTGVINQGESKPVVINISLSVTANSVVANAEELADTLRDPVYQIINDAWTEAYNSNNVLRAKV